MLEDVRPATLASKGSRIKEVPERNNAAAAPGKATSNEASTRKGYYESWDKFDADQTLNDMDKDGENPPVKNEKKTGNTGAGSTAKPPTVDPVAANAEKDKVDPMRQMYVQTPAMCHC